VTITTTAGSAFDGTIGAFSDAYTGAPASDFVAAVNWGDGGPPTTATVQATSLAGTFVVDGGHTYAAPGTYGVTIGVAAKGGGAATLNATANVGSATSPPPKAKPQTFKLSLGRITRSRDRTFALRVGCPSGEASCRGKLTLYWVSGSSHRKLGSQLFLLAGSTKATIDIRVSASNARRIARHRSVQLQAAVVALDPTAGRSASQTVTTRVRIRR
jgi:hypothetical protein